jgi:hypothetical protein
MFLSHARGYAFSLQPHLLKYPSTDENRQIGEHQTEGEARHKAERLDPSRYDDEGQNIGHENVGVELDGLGGNPRLNWAPLPA